MKSADYADYTDSKEIKQKQELSDNISKFLQRNSLYLAVFESV
jgi:hypothetical protein